MAAAGPSSCRLQASALSPSIDCEVLTGRGLLYPLNRFMLYFFGKAFMTVCGCCCAKDDDSVRPEDEVTYEAALLARYAHTGGAPGGAKGGRSHSISTSSVALAGVPTYRLPHHPRYSEIFSNPLYKPVWFKAFGRLRYTTLVSALALSVSVAVYRTTCLYAYGSPKTLWPSLEHARQLVDAWMARTAVPSRCHDGLASVPCSLLKMAS